MDFLLCGPAVCFHIYTRTWYIISSLPCCWKALSPSIVTSVGSRPPLSPCRTKHVHDRDEKSEEADDSHVNQHGVEIAVLRHPLRDSE